MIHQIEMNPCIHQIHFLYVLGIHTSIHCYKALIIGGSSICRVYRVHIEVEYMITLDVVRGSLLKQI